eukprot:TRINITY_DN27213_c0_g1_i1.p1 TRINITY_DN27213_c0_g1~~TRINITY_DN27213_c0_g1_i1.p1  ORF type:complete len:222 (-),score=19.02 TRINITY_DN27213_c0_g1_i1:180-845(-)
MAVQSLQVVAWSQLLLVMRSRQGMLHRTRSLGWKCPSSTGTTENRKFPPGSCVSSMCLREFVDGMDMPTLEEDDGEPPSGELREHGLYLRGFLSGMELPLLKRANGEPQVPSWELRESSVSFGQFVDGCAKTDEATSHGEVKKMPMPEKKTSTNCIANHAMDGVEPVSTQTPCAAQVGLTSSSGGLRKLTRKPAGLIPRLEAERVYSPPPGLRTTNATRLE